MTIQDRIARAQDIADRAAQAYADLPDGHEKDHAARAWSRAIDDLNGLKQSVQPGT